MPLFSIHKQKLFLNKDKMQLSIQMVVFFSVLAIAWVWRLAQEASLLKTMHQRKEMLVDTDINNSLLQIDLAGCSSRSHIWNDSVFVKCFL